MTVDVHTHILPPHWPDLEKRYGSGGWVQLEHCPGCRSRMLRDGKVFREVDPNCFDEAVRLRECDEAGVGAQVLSTVPVMFSYDKQPAQALDLAMLLNDHIADLVARFPSRFAGLATVPLQTPEAAARELERAMRSGHAGAQIGTHVNGWNLDDEALEPFWQAANDLGASLFVHPWDMLGQSHMTRHWLPWLVGMPMELSLAICSLTMGGVLSRYPSIRFMFAHGGGAFSGTVGRIDHGFEARPDLCQTRTPLPPSSFLDKIWVDALVHDLRTLRFTVDLYGDTRVALGTDYPFPLGEAQPGALIRSAGFAPDAERRLLRGNAIDWLGGAGRLLKDAP